MHLLSMAGSANLSKALARRGWKGFVIQDELDALAYDDKHLFDPRKSGSKADASIQIMHKKARDIDPKDLPTCHYMHFSPQCTVRDCNRLPEHIAHLNTSPIGVERLSIVWRLRLRSLSPHCPHQSTSAALRTTSGA